MVGFIMLFNRRTQLGAEQVKKYFYMLYQGVKDKVFYWEFINTTIKIVVLFVSTIISSLSIY